MYKENLALNNLQWLICYKNQTKPNKIMRLVLFLSLFLSLSLCYITYAMDFRFVPNDPVCYDKLSCCD